MGVRNLADPIRVDSANPSDPMAQLAVVLLALFAQMERTYMLERAAHVRSVATAKGRRIGRPSVVDADKLAYAVHLRDAGHTLAEIVAKSGITRTTLYRHLPPRPAALLTAAAPAAPADEAAAGTPDGSPAGPGAQELLEAVDWPDTYRPACPGCGKPVSALREQYRRRAGVHHPVVVALAVPCGCAVDEHAAGLRARAVTGRPRHHEVGVAGLVPEPGGYAELLEQLKVRASRVRAARAANSELLALYWSVGGTSLVGRSRPAGGAG